MSSMLVVPPCDPYADAGFLIMAPSDWVPMSGSNTIYTATVLLETGMIPLKEPYTEVRWDTAGGLITATAECEGGRCKSVSFDNVPAFVYAIDKEISLPEVGSVPVDIAYGGQWYVIVQASDLSIAVQASDGDRLIDLRKRLKEAVLAQCMPTHPENPAICGIINLIISEPLVDEDGKKSVKHTVIVTPGG
ncbi:proline racemase [Penicillium argentinense]|uniref:Proline racemase n=1 Tax=Penicillium argentinense TaxID=1131581 RepID=A0A9W9FPJ7_9EURO|nr:proline racemase [Penicillium argentinense]KAJ5104004.1 proline racemase [Penicillium argentinense]